jgi:hypothetical protein
MGRYHHPVGIERKEDLRDHMFGRNLKDAEAEPVFVRPGTCTSRVALVFAARGVPPGQSWAFKGPLTVG